METGGVEVSRIVSIDDAGTLVNPLLAEGQVHGGLAQGIGVYPAVASQNGIQLHGCISLLLSQRPKR